MGKIIKLDQKTANLIAAGEVVERPASVVKELVENSIDAQATNIKIKLVDAGIVEINIIDDGLGMDVSDARLAVEPHATSKISTGNDLFRITTLGFRGEALPSIAAVSFFKLKTSIDGNKGIMYSLRGGSLVSEAIVACNRGTDITVKNLFFNTPARLQNMSAPSVELSYIVDFINKIAMANPNIAFTLINNDKELVHTYGNDNLLETISIIYGAPTAKTMIEFYGDNNYFTVSGYTSNLTSLRSTRNHITVIANGRVIRNNNIVNAVIKGYQERLMGGKYPISILKIELDPGLVDVNVHPAKAEVRFSNEQELISLITNSIIDSLEKSNLIVDLDQTYQQEIQKNDNFMQSNPSLLAEEKTVIPTDILDFKEDANKDIESLVIEKSLENPEEVPDESENDEIIRTNIKEQFTQQSYNLLDEDIHVNRYKLPKMKYLGQLFGTYMLAQGDNEMFLIDQHAAAERLNYERIIRELKKEDSINYELLVPLKLDFTASEAILIEEHLIDFQKMAIEIEHFGGNTFTVRKIPVWLPKGLEKEYLEEIITQVINKNKKEKYEFLNGLAKSLACKQSIKANEYHNTMEMEYLLEELAKADNPFTCPHGRPTIVKFSKYEIEKWFKRVV